MGLSAGTCIYEWGAESNLANPSMVYTTTSIPTTSSQLYDSDGNTLALTITSVSAGSIVVNISGTNYTFNADTENKDSGLTTTTLTVTPSTTSQTLTPTSGIDGYDKIIVSPVTSDIDVNLIASNIKAGVTILGITGTYGDD